MPTLSSPDLVERLRTSRLDLRAVYMLGYAESALVQQRVIAAGHAFVPKPFTRQSLTGKIRETLAV
jgi:FixJ family two-component response regulator